MSERREVTITIVSQETLDIDRVEEWVFANAMPGDQIQIQDIHTGDIYYDNIGCDSL